MNEFTNLLPNTFRSPPRPLYLFSSTTLVYSKKKTTTKSTEYPKWQWTKYLFKLFDSHNDTHIRTVRCNCVYLAKRADAWACVIVDIRIHTRTQSRQTGLKNVEIMKMTVKSTKRSARRQRGE